MVRKGYKQTEVGEIPEDWDLKILGELCRQISDGTHYTPKYVNDGVPFYSVENVTARDFVNTKFISRAEHEKLIKRCRPERGDILMTRITAGIVGDTKLIDWDVDASIYVSLALLKLGNAVSPEYIYRYTKSHRFLKDVEKRSLTNATPKKINMDNIGDIPIPLPRSSQEQSAIATVLTDIDNLILSLETLIAKKRDIKTATMQQLLTGKKRLPGFGEGKGMKQTELGEVPEDWGVRPLRELADFINGRAYSIHEWEVSGTPVIRLQNLTGRGEIFYYSNLTLPEKQYCHYGDLLYMWSATFGPIIWSGGKAIYHYHIWKVENKSAASKKFLYYKLDEMTERLKRTSSSGGTMLHVTKEKMEATCIACPSIEEQLLIGEILASVDDELKAYVVKLQKMKSIKQGMMQELLTGRTRLINTSVVEHEIEEPQRFMERSR